MAPYHYEDDPENPGQKRLVEDQMTDEQKQSLQPSTYGEEVAQRDARLQQEREAGGMVMATPARAAVETVGVSDSAEAEQAAITSPTKAEAAKAEADAKGEAQRAEAQRAEAEASTPPEGADATNSEPVLAKGSLPDDFPGRAALADAGVNTFTQLRKFGDVTEIAGIGPATAEKIATALAEADAAAAEAATPA